MKNDFTKQDFEGILILVIFLLFGMICYTWGNNNGSNRIASLIRVIGCR